MQKMVIMMKNDHFQPFDVASIFWIYEEDIDSNKDKKRGGSLDLV